MPGAYRPAVGFRGASDRRATRSTARHDSRLLRFRLGPHLHDHFGNPSSGHAYGRPAQDALAHARRQVAALIGVDAAGIVFSGSGSEANNLAIRGAVLASGLARPHVITQVTEHPAVLATCRALQRLHGVDVTYLPVDGHGLVDPADLAAAMRDLAPLRPSTRRLVDLAETALAGLPRPPSTQS